MDAVAGNKPRRLTEEQRQIAEQYHPVVVQIGRRAARRRPAHAEAIANKVADTLISVVAKTTSESELVWRLRSQTSVAVSQRDRFRQRPSLTTVPLEETTVLVEPCRDLENRDQVDYLLRRLHPTDQHIIRQLFIEGQSAEELSREMKVTTARIYQRRQRAIKSMAKARTG